MLDTLKKIWQLKKLKDQRYQYLFTQHPNELVSFDCETTSLNVKEAEIISIGAVKIRNNTVLTSESFYIIIKPEGIMEAKNVTIHGLRPKDVSQGVSVQEGITQLLEFIGGRTLVGYYVDYDIAMVNKFLKPMIGIKLPNKKIEVSGVFYDQERKKNAEAYIDLHMATIISKLNLPDLPRHDALNDSINVALMYLSLKARDNR